MSIYKEIHEKKQKVSNLIGHLAEAEVSGLSGQTEQIADPAGHRSSAKSTESLQLVIIKMKAERQEMTDKLTKITDENQQLRQMLAARSVEKDDFDKLKSGHTALLTQLKKCQSALAGRFTLAQELNAANEELQRQLKELKSADCPTLPCVKFNPVKTVDSLEEEKIPSELQSITAMEEYSAHSFEVSKVI